MKKVLLVPEKRGKNSLTVALFFGVSVDELYPRGTETHGNVQLNPLDQERRDIFDLQFDTSSHNNSENELME